ncbi:MAG: hypothetical protein JRJ77_12470 [Deltaproteobacteria bacterium]|nr:hypothetical protein [Deltaproteobacteria bacterium]MBW2341636.1 hypothetical protein [Deltaproteobacteria bacterium]
MHFDCKRCWWRFGKPSMNFSLGPGTKKVPSYIPVANEIARRMGERMDGQPLSSPISYVVFHNEWSTVAKARWQL